MSTSVEIQLSQDEGLVITTRCEAGVWNYKFQTPGDFNPAVFKDMPEQQMLITLHAFSLAVDNYLKE
jgi:hypothetical protein